MQNANDAVIEFLLNQLRQQLTNNPYKQQCEDLTHEVLSLKNQLRDASAMVAELQKDIAELQQEVEHKTEVIDYLYSDRSLSEQSGCRKEDTQECKHEWSRYIVHPRRKICLVCGAKE